MMAESQGKHIKIGLAILESVVLGQDPFRLRKDGPFLWIVSYDKEKENEERRRILQDSEEDPLPKRLSDVDPELFEQHKGSFVHGDLYECGINVRAAGHSMLWRISPTSDDFYLLESLGEYGYSTDVFFGDAPLNFYEESFRRWFHVSMVPPDHFVWDEVKNTMTAQLVQTEKRNYDLKSKKNHVALFPEDFMWVHENENDYSGWVRASEYPDCAPEVEEEEDGDDREDDFFGDEDGDDDGEDEMSEENPSKACNICVLEKKTTRLREMQANWWDKRNGFVQRVAQLILHAFFREFGVPRDVSYLIAHYLCQVSEKHAPGRIRRFGLCRN